MPAFPPTAQPYLRAANWLRRSCLLTCWVVCAGCRATAPIHVWQPPQVETPTAAKIALSPVAGNRELSQRIEHAILAQRPAVCAEVALITAEQLIASSPIRLVSTTALTNDLTALHAARAAGADVLLQGEIVSTDLTLDDLMDADEEAARVESSNMNQVFFQRLRQSAPEEAEHNLLLSWRVIDVPTGQTLDAQSFTLRSQTVAKEYPDLAFTEHNPASLLIAASARETWKSIAPVVSKSEARLDVPWLQPGAWQVRRGVRAAKQGDWPRAEQAWRKVADRYWFSASAHHNLAIALAAREDFPSAKAELSKGRGIFNRRLSSESLFWLDRHHRLYHQAHGLSKPVEGWAFPEPDDVRRLQLDAEPVNLEDLPWWTAIPFTKPPEWSWHGWLSQAGPW